MAHVYIQLHTHSCAHTCALSFSSTPIPHPTSPDPTPTLYRALALNQGFAPDIQISAYLKLLTMLAGVGSPGTIQEVLRGYLGDRNSPPVFSGTNPFDVLGSGYQRPFELATLRLYNMQAVLSNCMLVVVVAWWWLVVVVGCWWFLFLLWSHATTTEEQELLLLLFGLDKDVAAAVWTVQRSCCCCLD